MIRAVSEAGFVPRVKYENYIWSDARTPDQMADYMLRNYYSEEENKDGLYRETLSLARRHAGPDGKVTDEVSTRVAWIYWKTEEQR